MQRFDGTRYKTFRSRKDDLTSIPNNSIAQALIDKKNNLWLITADQKVGIFDTRRFIYHEITVKVKNESFLRHGKKLVCDEEGNVFLIFVDAGLVTLNEKKQEFSDDYNFIPVQDNWMIGDLVQQPGTKKYFIGARKGMIIYNRQTNHLSYRGHNEEKEGFIEAVGDIPVARDFLMDSKGRLWFDSWFGGTPLIYAYDLKRNETVIDKYSLGYFTKNYFEISGFLQQRNGTIWVKGLEVFGKYIDKEKGFQLVYNGYENEQSIAYSRVNNFFEDREENIWVATNTNGLYHFKPAGQFFSNIRQINRRTGLPGDGSVMSFIQTRKGTLFVGAWSDGLYNFDKDFKMIPIDVHRPPADEKKIPFTASLPWSLAPSKDSDIIWMGTQPGVFKIDQRTHLAIYYNPPIMQYRTVRQVAEDKFGNLWMGTQSLGLFKWTAEKGKRKFDYA